MFEEFFESAVDTVTSTFSAVNALHFGVLKRMGVLSEFSGSFTEIQSSNEEHNLRLDNERNVPFLVNIRARVSLDGFLDPDNRNEFLRWHFVEGSYVTLPGVAENAPMKNGRLTLSSYDTLEYSFEFTGKDGVEYVYRGEKKLSIFNPIRSWSNLKGGVYEKESGLQVLDSITFFGGGDLPASILPFLNSIKVR